MRIIQIAPCYVDIQKETGGVANIVRQICLALEKNRIETILICSNTELRKEITDPKIINYSEFLTIHIIKQHKNSLWGPKEYLISILKKIDNISLAHVHTCFSSITETSLNYFSCRRIPCVFTPHGKLSPSMYNNKRIFKEIYFRTFVKKSLNKVNSIIASSCNEIEYMRALKIKSQFSFIYNGYNLIEENNSIISPKILEPKSYLLFLGYLDPRKQPDLLIKAYKQSTISAKYKLVLAGPDSYNFQSYLEQLCTSLNLQIGKEVIFTGRVIGSEKWSLLKNAKSLFLPSKGEGWPVVMAEAIGSQIPLVISKECNFSEITKMRLGIEVDDFSTEKWAYAMNEICFNQELVDEFDRNLKLYKDLFTWEKITQQWINAYKAIIDETTA